MGIESLAEEATVVGDAAEPVDRRFAGLLDQHLARSFRLAALILGNESEAEDAVQEATVAAWRHFRELRDPNRFDAWFQRIVVNNCRDRLRRRRFLPLIASATDYQPADRADELAAIPERDALRRCLGA